MLPNTSVVEHSIRTWSRCVKRRVEENPAGVREMFAKKAGAEENQANGKKTQQTYITGRHLAFVVAGGVILRALGAGWVLVRTLIP